MIERMRKLNLIAMGYDRDVILNALRRTNAVEVTQHGEEEGTCALVSDGEELSARLAKFEAALDILSTSEARYRAARGEKPEREAIRITYAEFAAAREKEAGAEALVKQINALSDERALCLSEGARLSRALSQAAPYRGTPLPFSAYADTRVTKTRLGLVPRAAWQTLRAALDALPLAAYDFIEGEEVLLAITVHRDVFADAEAALSAAGFVLCPYHEGTGGELCEKLEEEARALAVRSERVEGDMHALSPSERDLKIYCDYLRFEVEKAELGEKLRGTEKTFLLEAFVPAEREEEVKAALGEASGALYYEFSDPAEDEFVPTLLKNNKVVENFETITNMYSVPSARELDPNTVMSFFYSLFIGFIMADIGYGLLMMLGGGFLYWKNREKSGGIKPLAGVFAVGGIFAIIWGFLFNSFFGIVDPETKQGILLPFTIMPDAQTKMWSFIGIDMPAVLLISLLIGIVQLMAGYLCKMAQCIHRNRFWDGVFDGLVWAVFSLGALVAAVGLIEDLNLSFLAPAGGIIAAAALIVAVLTAGRHEKFLGKITKGFSSLYGLINYFTDVLSYIRLYGLMLTGAVIAQIISQYSIQFLMSGNLLIVLGAVLMVVGHVFNLAISLLGAYIHTARLQYVEFFGKFYEGDGALFTPLGSDRKYVCVL